MLEKSREIFGNRMSEKDVVKAEKTQKKFLKNTSK